MTGTRPSIAVAQAGVTLIEVMIATAIAGVILAPLGAGLAILIRSPITVREEVVTFQQLEVANLLVREDASVARDFDPGVQPDYGTFTWFEFSGSSAVPVSARYYWDPGGDSIIDNGLEIWPRGTVRRVLTRNGEVTPAQVVAERVVRYENFKLEFTDAEWKYDAGTRTWSYREGQATTTIDVESPRPVGYGRELEPLKRSVALAADVRPQKDIPAALPARLPPPPPLPNQIDFYVSGEPVLTVGTYRSGSGASLKLDDTNHYVTRGAGTPRTVTFEVTSEAIDYTNISNMTVSVTGQSDTSGVAVEVYVHNPSRYTTNGGYPTSPDGATNLTTVNTDKTILVAFDAENLSYLNSLTSKTVKIKVVARANAVFDFAADQVVFQAAGQPAPTFFRDFLVAELPVLEIGSASGGTHIELEKDDTSYYRVTQTNNTVQWTAVSQGFAFDTISSVEIIVTARVTKGAAVQKVFAFNPTSTGAGPDGYLTTASSTFTYDATNVDRTVSFSLNAAEVAYVASLFPQEIQFRLQGVDPTAQWVHEADRVIFRVRP